MELQDLFLKLQEGDFTFFDTFYERSKNVVFYNILSCTKNYDISEDILQETYVKFLASINNINKNVNILGYLMKISKNLALDYFKKNKRIEYVEDELLIPSYMNLTIDEEELVNKIKGILNQKEFLILILHVLNDMTFEEIKEIICKPLGSILWTYNNAIKKLTMKILRKHLKNVILIKSKQVRHKFLKRIIVRKKKKLIIEKLKI